MSGFSSAPANVIATDNCGTPDLTYNEVITGTDCSTGITYTRTWTATDACGNETIATQTITVIDNVPPVILVAFTSQNVECGQQINIPQPDVTDNCGVIVDFSSKDEIIDGPCPQAFTFIRTFTATDACGNISTETVTVNVSDNTAPDLNNVPTDTTIYLGMGQTIPPPPE
ncbi:MAG: hypothetical protein R2784_08105 [Saprospiraceae bacterium]